MKTQKKFKLFINTLLKNCSKKKISFIQQDFHGLENILSDMFFSGLINGFVKNVKNFQIYLKYSAFGESLFFKKNDFYKQSLKKIISLSQIKSFNFLEKYSFIYLLTAEKGIILQKRALHKRIGGLFLTKIK